MRSHVHAVREALASLGEHVAQHVAGNALAVLVFEPEMDPVQVFASTLRHLPRSGVAGAPTLGEETVLDLARRATVALERSAVERSAVEGAAERADERRDLYDNPNALTKSIRVDHPWAAQDQVRRAG